MLPYQTPGISNKDLVFTRDVQMFALWMDILVKSAIFYNTPPEKWFGPRNVIPWNFPEEPNFYNLIYVYIHVGAISSEPDEIPLVE